MGKDEEESETEGSDEDSSSEETESSSETKKKPKSKPKNASKSKSKEGSPKKAKSKTGSKVPKGLDQLAQMDSVVIKQNVDLLEIFCQSCCEKANSYEICNSLGQKWYTAHEISWCCVRLCCKANRPFTMEIRDLDGETVFLVQRYWRCQSYLCCCCRQKIIIELPDGEEMGRVYQDCSFCRPWFSITGKGGEPITNYIKGPCCQCNICCKDVNYRVLDANKSDEVGNIAKNFGGFLKEAFTDADNFTVKFPKDCDVDLKAVLIGAALLLDYMFFEDSPADDNNL